MAPFHAAKTKVQLKLTAHRCQLLQEKKSALAKKDRKDIASLVEKGKLETARIKTEGLIGEDIALELLEIMELYTEMLIARFGLLEMNTRDPDPAIREPLCAIIHAAPRIELREMHQLREMLMQKYGRDFAVAAMDNTDNCVSERIMSRLRVETPGRDLVDMYITEICKAYNVPFTSSLADDNLVEGEVSSWVDAPQSFSALTKAYFVLMELTLRVQPPEPMPKPHAAADGPLPPITLSSESSASTKGDATIAAVTGTVAPSSEETTSRRHGTAAPGSTPGTDASEDASGSPAKGATTPKNGASTSEATTTAASTIPKKSADEQRYDDLEARFAALKRK